MAWEGGWWPYTEQALDQAEDTQAAPERQNLPGTVMVNVVSSINLSVQYTEGLEYSRAAQAGCPVPCALCSAREGKPEALEQWTGD